LVRKKWDRSPTTQIVASGTACGQAIFDKKPRSDPIRLATSCIAFIQNRIAKVLSVRVSAFREDRGEREREGGAEHDQARRLARSPRPAEGSRERRGTPRTTATMRPRVSVSRRSGTARTATQIGAVNSTAKTVASGSSVTPSVHPYGAGEMHGVSAKMHEHAAGAQGRASSAALRAPARAGSRRRPRCGSRAFSNTEKVGRERADRDGGRRKGQEGAAHPEDDGQDVAVSHCDEER
jgi:hypothetical protein